MRDIRVNALVIRAINYSENDKLLTLLTLERGKITARIRGCKSPKSKLRISSSPLSFGEYILSCKYDKYLVTGCSVKENFYSIAEDLDKYYGASILLEMANKLIQEDEDCKDILVLILKMLKNITYTNINPHQLTIISMLNILKVTGFKIQDLDTSNDIKDTLCYFSLMDGSISSNNSIDSIRISSFAIDCIRKSSNQDIDVIEDYNYDSLVYRECISILDKYFTYQSEKNLKSTKALLNMIN